MDSSKSSVKHYPKPINIFYIWYSELCRRMNSTPARVVKPAKLRSQTILEFVGDRLKFEEWSPIVNALRSDTSLHVISIKSRIGNCQFLHDVDTEEKARHMKRRFGSLWTAFILRQLTKSISTSLRNTEVLTFLELDGLPLFAQYLEPLLQALKKNKTVKQLSFANSSIKSAGCEMLCEYLRYAPNIEVINLSGCALTSDSGEYLAKLIKYQQINRYCESWHNSLRYENPQNSSMRGIKRITLNCNFEFGDTGFQYILDELEDDLWIKALDLQRCGITEKIGSNILNVVQYNRSLEIVDLRQNDLLDIKTIEKVLQLLREKQDIGFQPEFQWCNTALTLTLDSLGGSTSKFSMTTPIHKTKSAPIKNTYQKSSMDTFDAIRKTKTLQNIPKHAGRSIITDLNIKLQSEIQKRKITEKKNEELIQQLNEMKLTNQFQHPPVDRVKNKTKVVIDDVKKSCKNLKTSKFSTEKIIPTEQNSIIPIDSSVKNGAIKKNGFKNDHFPNGFKNGVLPHCSNGIITGHKNGVSTKVISSACKIFENLLKKETCVEVTNDCDDLLRYATEQNPASLAVDNMSAISSDSLQSLYQYMDELKTNENGKYLIKECE
ncbi:centrosomal protein of 78 kDa [Diabrotica undecimpunctata]|uniref:centrosomal protein of 78 kDa n=1 Tax=Diabrotica undecimpunctata TaxID=50387 RepID=UPI003B63632C